MCFVIYCSGIGNHVDIEDGYQSASREATETLQASGPVAEPNHENVNLSKKKNTRSPSLAYAQVDISEIMPEKVIIMTKYCRL